MKEGHTKQIVGELVKGMSPSVRVNCNESQLVMEILPLLLDIIVPNFRPVSTLKIITDFIHFLPVFILFVTNKNLSSVRLVSSCTAPKKKKNFLL